MLEKKPWYAREDFWVPAISVISVIVLESFGVELPVEALAAVIVMVISIVVSSTVQENKATEARAQLYVVNKEFEILRMEAGMQEVRKE